MEFYLERDEAVVNIPPGNLLLEYKSLKGEIDSAIQRVLSSGWFILGREVQEFERAFADYCGARFCVGVASGVYMFIGPVVGVLMMAFGSVVGVFVASGIIIWIVVGSGGGVDSIAVAVLHAKPNMPARTVVPAAA